MKTAKKQLAEMLAKTIEMVLTQSKAIVERGEGHAPILFLLEGGSLTVCLLSVARNPAEAILPILVEQQPEAYVFVAEAWSHKGRMESATTAALLSGKRVVDLPLDDRDEVVMVVTVAKNQNPICLQAVINDREGERQLGEYHTILNLGDQVPTTW